MAAGNWSSVKLMRLTLTVALVMGFTLTAVPDARAHDNGALGWQVRSQDCVFNEAKGGYVGRYALRLGVNHVPKAGQRYHLSTKMYIDQWKPSIGAWRKTGGTVTRVSGVFRAADLPNWTTPAYKDFLGRSAPPDQTYRGVAIVRLRKVRDGLPDSTVWTHRLNGPLSACPSGEINFSI